MKKIAVRCRGNRVYEFDPATSALLVIDMQQEFFAEDSAECINEMRAIIPRIESLMTMLRELKCPVIHTRESYKPDLSDVNSYRKSLAYVGKARPLGRFCILGEPGHEFVNPVRPLAGETVIDKASFGAFFNTPLDDHLRCEGIDHLIICGVTTQCCVQSTLREAVDRGYWCLTVADCCAALEAGLHEGALALIAGEGHLFGWVADVKQIRVGISS